MNFSVSHIAWPPEAEMEALESLRGLGISELEVAPVRAFGNPMTAGKSDVCDRAAWYRDQGFSIGSFQALLFGTDGLHLFGTEESRQALKDMLIATGRVAGWAGAGPMVFGAPKNRLRGDLSHAAAVQQAAAFFREVGDACAESGSCLVIEANPEEYGADFCTRLEQAAELVEAADSPGFALHVDAGGMALSGEDFEPVLRQAGLLLRHVHASQPNLGSFADPHPVHQRLATVLDEIGFAGTVSIEMRTQPEGLEAIAKAIGQVREIYDTRRLKSGG